MRPTKVLHVSKRQGSRVPQFTRRIPQDLKEKMRGKVLEIPIGSELVPIIITERTKCIRVSLRTIDNIEARKRTLVAATYLDKCFQAARSTHIVNLSHRQIIALAGEFYVAWASDPDSIPQRSFAPLSLGLPEEPPTDYQYEAARLVALSTELEMYADAAKTDDRTAIFGPVAEALLLAKGLASVEPEAIERLVLAVCRVLPDALRTRARYALGDYSPDANILKYPQWEMAPSGELRKGNPMAQARGAVSLIGLADGWWVEAKSAGAVDSTRVQYARTMRLLSEFLGHDDARMVSAQDIVRYKDHRLSTARASAKSPPTAHSFKKSDLAVLKSVFSWAVANLLIPANPAHDIKVKAGKRAKLREREFTEDEALALLHKAEEQNDTLLHWVPWLCAYTGCRLGEAVQLRKEDVRHLDHPNVWVMRITPDAGTVKSKEAREVPLHAHLVELGFIAFLRRAPDGYLFLNVESEGDFRSVSAYQKEKVRRQGREVVSDPNVAPNHGWRHTFKSRGFEAGIQEKVLDAICGHSPSSEGRKYGSVTLKTKMAAIEMFPRFEVNPPPSGNVVNLMGWQAG